MKRATIFAHAFGLWLVWAGAVAAEGVPSSVPPEPASAEIVGEQSSPASGAGADASAQCDRLAADPKDKDRPAGVDGVEPPSVEAIEHCSAAVTADPQNARLNYQAGRAYRQSQDFAKAFFHFDRASSLGSLRATVAIADAYMSGSGVAKDEGKALDLFKRAASQGDVGAVLQLGQFYSKGPSKNVDLAINWLSSVEDGQAFIALGDLYVNEVKNDAIALKWYRKAAALEIPLAYDRLGWAYYNGRGVPQDYEQAIEWDKLAWAEFPTTAVRIATSYSLLGDTTQMLSWFERGIARGDALSARQLAIVYQYGPSIGGNHAKAMELYQKALELGDDDALTEIGKMYQRGEGVQQDIPRAIEYYRTAIEKGQSVYWRVADAYEQMSPRDDRSAFDWNKKGAETGEMLSMYYLAVQYRDGVGVKQDYKEALAWFKKAADAGDIDAMNQVGVFYHDGRGTRQNYVEAGRWYEKAAAAGQAWGNRNLAYLFAHGQGVNRDTWLAVDLLELAMTRSDEVCSGFKKTWSNWPNGFLQAFQSRLADRYAYQGASDGKLGSGSMAAIDTMCAKN